MKGTGKFIFKQQQHSNTKRVTNFKVDSKVFNNTVENNRGSLRVRKDKVLHNVKS